MTAPTESVAPERTLEVVLSELAECMEQLAPLLAKHEVTYKEAK
jgi:hypothetical protein